MPTFQSTLDLLGTIAILALLSVPYGAALRKVESERLRQVLLGALFGIAATTAMVNPVQVADGVIFDLRALPITLAGAFFGWPGALAAALPAAAMRISLGGIGVLPGLVSMTLAAGLGLLWAAAGHRVTQDRRLQIALLGAMSVFSNAAMLLLPYEIAMTALRNVVPVSGLFSFVGVMFVGSLMMREERTVDRERSLRLETTTDPLTGIYNRRGFERLARKGMRRVSRGAGDAILVLDLDHFKKINDTHGHDAGDDVLREVARRFRSAVRHGDIVARFGGEEFVAWLPAIRSDEVEAIAERVRRAIAAAPIEVETQALKVTASVGGVWSAHLWDVEAAISWGDAALYSAKEKGRNRVELMGCTSRPEEMLALAA